MLGVGNMVCSFSCVLVCFGGGEGAALSFGERSVGSAEVPEGGYAVVE